MIFLILIFQQGLIEAFQLKKDGFFFYIKQRTNKVDQFSLIINLTTIFLIYADVELYKIRIVASMGVVALWIQMFFWFRLFDNLA